MHHRLWPSVLLVLVATTAAFSLLHCTLLLTLQLADGPLIINGSCFVLLQLSALQDGVTRSRARPSTRSLPDWALAPDAAVFLNIPMDAETPR